MKKSWGIIALLAAFIFTSGFGCKQSGEVRSFKPVTLEYWGVFEEERAMALLTGPYSQRHPKISIRYRRFQEDEYKEKLLTAWAQGLGPDVFMIPNTKMREYLKFIEPMPKSMKVPVEYETGTIKKEIVTELKTYAGLTTKQVRDNFLDVVGEDVIINDQIYGLPHSVDTLSVFYNRKLLKSSNIPLPAKDWNELIAQAPAISKLDTNDNLVQSAVALGTTNNIPVAADILSTIMMQIGITVGDEKGPRFQANPKTLEAIQFYLSFAQPGNQNYSWSDKMTSALDAFTAEKLAYFIGYPYHAQLIREANPKLDWDIVPMFKPADGENTPVQASYWVSVVSKPPKGSSAERKQRAELSWHFLMESSDRNYVKPYLSNKNNPRTTALKTLVEEQKQDQILGPFAQNLLNATNWYHGYNSDVAQKHLLDMAASILTSTKPANDIGSAANLIQQTYFEPQS